MSGHGTQSQATAKSEGAAIRVPESKPASHQQAPTANTVLLNLQGGLGNRATTGLLRNVGVLQPSLRIGPVNDRYEREANRMADRAMQGEPGRAGSEAPLAQASQAAVQRVCSDCEEELQREPLPSVGSISEVRIQRACTECEEELEEEEPLQRDANTGGGVEASSALESRVSSLQGRGSPLTPAQRGFFEPRLGHDFGAVRLHTGPAASDAARLARARAFTVGRNIAFGAGEYRPEARSGRRLLAHELTHVVQQTPLTARRKPLLQRQAETEDVARAPEPETPAPEPAPVGPEPGSDEISESQARAPGLLVEDEAVELGPGQMTRSEFLAATRAAVCAAADAAFAGTEFTTQGCPYVELVLRFYENRSAERIERDLVSYLPAAAGAVSASDYVPLIANRVRQSVETFVASGQITGIPEGVPNSLTSLVEGASSVGGLLFKARDGGPRGSADPRAVQAQLGTGRPLAGSARSRMQSAFGRSFSDVKVHTGSTASRLSDRFNARAFTVGNHVAFGSGEYRPGTPVGDALVAHELAHVVQQRGASASVAPLQTGTAATGALERDADRSAAGAVASLWRGTKDSVSRVARNAIPSLRSGLSIQRCQKETCSEGDKTITVDLVQLDGSTRTPATDLAEANKIYKQCCVKFAVGKQPPAVSNALTKAWLGGDTVLAVDSTCGGVSTEEKDLFDKSAAKFSLSSRMRVFYVASFTGIVAGGYSSPEYCATGDEAPYVNHVVMQNNVRTAGLAHEFGHILLNSGDHTSPPNLMEPASGTVIDASQCKTIYNNA